jgi:hypothetical protein
LKGAILIFRRRLRLGYRGIADVGGENLGAS